MSGSHSRVWISVSDMMTGLMMIFLFISVVFMQQVDAEKKAVEDIAVNYRNYQEDLREDLLKQFAPDLTQWNAEILSDTTIRFNEPDVLFDAGSKDIKVRFQQILDDFFPRYVGVLASERYRKNIEEVRIEGHTSSDWDGSKSLEDRYLNNALLSQQRSFAILQYCFSRPALFQFQPWLTTVLRANGLAFASPVLMNGKEHGPRSRRVEFRVKVKADEKIKEMLNTMHKPHGNV